MTVELECQHIDISASSEQEVPAQNIAIHIDSLIVGRCLVHPIYDSRGVLLLTAGAMMTPKVRQRLKDRQIDEVYVSPVDAVTLMLNADLFEDHNATITFDTELTRELDEMIESGRMFLADSGMPVRDKLVLHGCKAYNPESRERLMEQHRETAGALDRMMKQLSHGVKLKSSEISTIAATYLTELTSDADNVLTAATEASRDNSISQHCLQMSMLGMALGMELGMDAENVRTIGICGLVHDWGMTLVPREIRDSTRILSSVEYLAIKKHSIYSLEMLQKIEGIPKNVPLICYQVHERPNGMGYPRGRSGESIHKCARILNVADAFVHLTSRQPHRPPLMPYAAMECLLKMVPTKAVDGEVVRMLLNIQSLFSLGSLVTLSDGSVGRVIRRNGNDFAHPIVAIVQNVRGESVDPADPDGVVQLGEGKLRVLQVFPNPKRGEIALSPEEFQFQLKR